MICSFLLNCLTVRMLLLACKKICTFNSCFCFMKMNMLQIVLQFFTYIYACRLQWNFNYFGEIQSHLCFGCKKKGNLGDPYSICLGQGNLLMGIDNWSGAARSGLQDPKHFALIRFWAIVNFKNLQYKNFVELWNHK